ncbi:putative pre-16S rRNA nuclease [Caldinitratiruptor microaerophilus]|uniref:Putative pre-16S rRNA nuclease n=1 Tax=Caldinitratiruptor microaerophilus TaxID=671077 RepID=A0AA35CLT1_9FIRM|nr:Holliday junction resolvase RuvX [Caldinitratiruptor microaerophilus]BDG59666.1 putative pre-16S rRNA nuclease [Caldinitratiruptor microaerophilus]
MRVAGLDVGEKTIGVAVSDPLGWTAQGVEVVRRTTLEADLERLRTLFAGYEVGEVVVGLPRDMSGGEGAQARLVREFADALARALGLPVTLWDERLTTAQATRALLEGDVSRRRRRQVVDRLAAQLILQAFLDRRRAAGGARPGRSGGAGGER